MTWTKEGFESNIFARKAKKIESVKRKDINLIAKKLNYTDLKDSPTENGLRTAKFSVERLLKEGWLKELPDRYAITDKTKKRLEFLKEISERGELD